MGWRKQGESDFGRGMHFQGIDIRYKRGPTGAQSPTPRYFDHVLGVKMHGGKLKDVLDQFHGFMPPAHEEAMKDVRNIKDYVMKHRNNKELVDAYNKAIAGLAKWRRMHFIALVEKFVVRPIQNGCMPPGATKEQAWAATGNGTGGSDIRTYLTDHIRTTEETAFGRCPHGRWWDLAGVECPFGGGHSQRVDPDPLFTTRITSATTRMTLAPPSARDPRCTTIASWWLPALSSLSPRFFRRWRPILGGKIGVYCSRVFSASFMVYCLRVFPAPV